MKKSILIYDSNRRPAYGNEIFDKINDKLYDIKSLGQQEKKWVNLELEFFNLANHNFDLGRRIIALIRQQKKFENDSSSFNFRDLWVTWEGMFEDKNPGEKKETFQVVALDAIKIFLSTNFLPKIKNVLKGGLKSHYSIELDGKHNYLLKDQELDKLGLGKEKGEYIKAKKFRKRYRNIYGFVDFLLLREIINRVDVFVSDPNQYYLKVKKWVDNTIDEVYFERNLEVHNNEKTDLSRFKLQGDFLEISSITMHEILRNINRNTKGDIRKVFDRMENKANRI